MKLIRFNHQPFFTDFLDQAFNSSDSILNKFSNCEVPAANIIENDQDFQIDLVVPGRNKEDFKISIENNLLSITSENEQVNESNTKNYTRREFVHSGFCRTFTLSKNIDTEKINASYQNGILQITLPKKEEEKSNTVKKINVS